MVICQQRGADLHMAQLNPLPLTVCCSSKIQIGFTFLVPAHLGSPGKRAVKRVCVCVCVCGRLERIDSSTDSALYLGLLKERSLCNRLYLYMHLYSCSELVREERSIAAAPLQRQQDVMTSLAASPSQSTPRNRRAAANQRPAGQHQGYKRRAPFQNRHSMRRERICRISPIDRRVSEL